MLPLIADACCSCREFCHTAVLSCVGVYMLWCTDQLSMPLFWLSMATFVAGITGALAQLWMGYIGDRFQSRFGRRRPFIAVLSVFGGIAIICLMFPPDSIIHDQAAVIVWFFVFFTVVEVCSVQSLHVPTSANLCQLVA